MIRLKKSVAKIQHSRLRGCSRRDKVQVKNGTTINSGAESGWKYRVSAPELNKICEKQ